MHKLSRHALVRIRYGDSNTRRTSTSPKQVRQLFSRSDLVVKHCEYHVVYAPYDMECLGAVIQNDIIVTVMSDHQIPWLLPKLLAMRRYVLYALRKEMPKITGPLSRDNSTMIEVIAASKCKQRTVYAATMFDFSEQWFKSVWFLKTLAEAIGNASDGTYATICVMYTHRGKKEFAPVHMIMELLEREL